MMHHISRFAGVLAVALAASESMAIPSFSTVTTPLTGANAGFDRVTLYALGAPGEAANLTNIELYARATAPHGLRFQVIDADDAAETTATLSLFSTNPSLATRTRLNSTLSTGTTLPYTIDSADVELYRQGLTVFGYQGFDGSSGPQNERGVKIDASQNGGHGGAIFAAIVPTGSGVTFAGKQATNYDVASISTFHVSTDPDEPDVPTVFSPLPQTVTLTPQSTRPDGRTGFAFSVRASDPIPTNGLSLSIGAVPAGVQVSAPAGNQMNLPKFTVSGTVDGSLIGQTLTIPFTVYQSADQSRFTTDSFQLTVVPEPLTAAGLCLSSAMLIRRRGVAR